MNFMTFHVLGIIIPTDEVIFFRGVGQPPTSLNCRMESFIFFESSVRTFMIVSSLYISRLYTELENGDVIIIGLVGLREHPHGFLGKVILFIKFRDRPSGPQYSAGTENAG